MNVNGLNILQSKDTEWKVGWRNKSLQYAACKWPTLGQRTHKDWKWGDGKIYFMQIEMKRKQGGNTLIRQNRLRNKVQKTLSNTKCTNVPFLGQTPKAIEIKTKSNET